MSASVAPAGISAVPWIFTVEPSLFVFDPPVFASKTKPLSTKPVVADFNWSSVAALPDTNVEFVTSQVLLSKPVMKLPSVAVTSAAGVVPSALGVTDCLPTVTPEATT